ncbi:MAG TPA: TolC family protein [Fibrobacteraceae bacterium]|nr:TolC family protein [Fibrobacteraceae bacterium]
MIKWFLILAVTSALAQSDSVLTLDAAMQLILERNPTIQETHISNRQARNDVAATRGALLPTFSLNSDVSRVGPDFESGPDLNQATRTTYRTKWLTTLGATWTLFDGLSNWRTHQQRKSQAKAIQAHGKLVEQQSRLAISSVYLAVVQQQSLLRLQKQMLTISRERLTIVQTRRSIGSASLLEEQQALLDCHADSMALLEQDYAFAQSRRQLNQLLDRDLEFPFEVEPSFFLDSLPDEDSLWRLAQNYAPSMAEARLQVLASQSALQASQGTLFPSLKAYANYNFMEEYGHRLDSADVHDHGFLVGLALSMPLYDGGQKRAQRQQAREHLSLAKIQEHQAERQFLWDFEQAKQQYRQARVLLELSRENDSLASVATDLALAQYRMGAISSLDLRQAQEKRLNFGVALVNAQYHAKNAELQRKSLCGLSP